MDTETVLAQMLPKVTELLKALIEAVVQEERPTWVCLGSADAARGAAGRAGGPASAGGGAGQRAGGTRARVWLRGKAALPGPLPGPPPGPLQITSSLGPITLAQRASSRCPECKARGLPLDEQLGLGAAGRMSRSLQEQCGWLFALLPARLARQTLERFGWPAIAASQVREHGEALGAELEQREQQHQAQARVAAACPPVGQGPARQAPASGRLSAAPDGVMDCTTAQDPQTGKALSRELKVAAVYEREARAAAAPAPRDAAGGPAGGRARIVRHLQRQQPPPTIAPAGQAVRVSYVAETGPWQDFVGRLWAELWARGLGRPVQDLAVVADGSAHIDQAVDAELRLPGVQLTRILDLAHAHQHLWTVAHAAFGEGSAAGTAWIQSVAAALEQGDVNAVLDALEEVVSQAADPAAHTARQARDDCAARRDQLTYPRFVAAGYQIGSGRAESACTRFGTDRMKGAGMRWTVPGAQQVATLRLLVLSQHWEEVSACCRLTA